MILSFDRAADHLSHFYNELLLESKDRIGSRRNIPLEDLFLMTSAAAKHLVAAESLMTRHPVPDCFMLMLNLEKERRWGKREEDDCSESKQMTGEEKGRDREERRRHLHSHHLQEKLHQ